ncbi:MAG: YqcI/YcgG family protein [Gemmatimonadota bacterium]|nr:YqcI/YcgG family protein [Gemmatimonadota bacterium]
MTGSAADIRGHFDRFVNDGAFPCLAAKGVVRRQRHALGVFGALGEERAATSVALGLAEFAAGLSPDTTQFAAYVAVFPDDPPGDEVEFEERLWRQLRMLNELDPATEWDPAVSDNPDDPHFSFSFAGNAFFVVGLHPLSSRIARRFEYPALVFNPRSQFDGLRARGRYERLRDAIRARDVLLQGATNPMLTDFGARSEARQYSGRAVADDWRCPFDRGASS